MIRARRVTPLHHQARMGGRLFGSAMHEFGMRYDLAYQALLAGHCDVLTPETRGKWDIIQPTDALSYNFISIGQDIAFAQSIGKLFHWHLLISNGSLPTWLTTDLAANPGNPGHAQALITTYIDAIATQYGADPRGSFQSVDVVNEVCGYAADPGTYAQSVWFAAAGSGPAYIHHAFTRAKAEWGSNLIYVWNEDMVTRPTADGHAKRANIPVAIDALLDAGIVSPSELRVGLQCHLRQVPPVETIDHRGLAMLCENIAAMGVKVWISELDIDVLTVPDRQEQEHGVYTAIKVIADHCELERVTTWQCAERYSFPADRRAHPFDHQLRPTVLHRAVAGSVRSGQGYVAAGYVVADYAETGYVQ